MSNKPLEQFRSELSARVLFLLEKDNIRTIENFLTTSLVHLRSIGLTLDEVKHTRTVIARRKFRGFQTAESFASTKNATALRRLHFGCRALNEATRGGLSIRGINEFYGESASGKSQLCLQLALQVQLAESNGGLGKGAVYICTEDAFPSKRLCQMAEEYTRMFGDRKFLDNIFIEHALDLDHLRNCLNIRLPQLMKRIDIGLIIVDSMAGIFRFETDIIARAYEMRKIAHHLQTISCDFECAVVCVNQVTAKIDSNNREIIPSLGLAWSNLVTHRFCISKTAETTILETSKQPSVIRNFNVIFSPELPQTTASFVITESGVRDVK